MVLQFSKSREIKIVVEYLPREAQLMFGRVELRMMSLKVRGLLMAGVEDFLTRKHHTLRDTRSLYTGPGLIYCWPRPSVIFEDIWIG